MQCKTIIKIIVINILCNMLLGKINILYTNAIDSSLFFTPEQIDISENEISNVTNKNSYDNVSNNTQSTKTHLVLKGIIINPITNEWTIWINDQKLDSTRNKTIDGYSVIEVTNSNVLLISKNGNKITLKME